MKIREIKYPQMFKSYIDCISKTSRLAKLSTCKNDRNFQFAKLSPCEIKVFYSTLLHMIDAKTSSRAMHPGMLTS